jgi:hypothetical protein
LLTVLGIYNNHVLHIEILILLGIIFYVFRSYLETDAMIRAEYLSKEYMEEYIKEHKCCNKEEIDEIYLEYKKINKIGIPTYNYILISKEIVKVIIYTVLCFIINMCCH